MHQRHRSASTDAPTPATPAQTLERGRLQLRMRRLERVIDALEAEQQGYPSDRSRPPALRAAAEDFRRQHATLEARLDAIGGEPERPVHDTPGRFRRPSR